MPANKQSVLLLPLDAYGLSAEDERRFSEEMAKGMLPPTDPMLSGPVAAVNPADIQAPAVQVVIEKLYDVALAQRQGNLADKRRRTLVGLAAPQIGEPLRIIVVDTKIGPDRKRPGKLECFINPRIIWRSRETVAGPEGCFSAGPVWGVLRRSVAVKVRAYNAEGKPVERILEGFTARIMQHECDHLDGIRFADRIKSDTKRHWVHTEELHSYREHHNHWPRICARERWETFKRGKYEALP